MLICAYYKGKRISHENFLKTKYAGRKHKLAHKLTKIGNINATKKAEKEKKIKNKKELQKAGFLKARESKTFLRQLRPKKKKLFKKICFHEFCETEFKTSDSRQKYCSDFCRIMANSFNYCACGYPKGKQAQLCKKCELKKFPKKRDAKSGKFIKSKNIPTKLRRSKKSLKLEARAEIRTRALFKK